PAAAARPVAVGDVVEQMRQRVPALRILAQVRAGCLAVALTDADERRLRAAGADDAFVADLRASCVAAAPTSALVDSSGGLITPRVLQMQRACEQGDAVVCDSVAELYVEGIFAPKNRSRAADFLFAACAAGRTPSCTRAIDVLDASAEAADQQRAALVLTQRCEVDAPGGCRRLGALYQRGRGVPRDAE
ncbi:hypothetical protein PYV61_26450, partial [Roseisolibacter sp. H3M3-2]